MVPTLLNVVLLSSYLLLLVNGLGTPQTTMPGSYVLSSADLAKVQKRIEMFIWGAWSATPVGPTPSGSPTIAVCTSSEYL